MRKVLDPAVFAILALFLLPCSSQVHRSSISVCCVILWPICAYKQLMFWTASSLLFLAPKSPFTAQICTIFPPPHVTPQLIPYTENQPDCPSARGHRLAPFTCLYAFTPACPMSGACAFGTPPFTDIFLFHPQSSILSVYASKIKRLRFCRIQSTDLTTQCVQKHFKSHLKM